MRKNQTIALISVFLLLGSTLACNLFGRESLSEESSKSVVNNAGNTAVSTSPKSSAAVCPQTVFSVNEAKPSALKKYEGCLVSVRGKIWEVGGNNSIALIDTTDRTDYAGKINISGDFSSNDYYEIGRKISAIKIDGQYERLPMATFTGTVDGDGWLKKCVLTDVQK